MMKIVFKRLEPSELAKEIVEERLALVISKFPDLEHHQVTVTLKMDNSPSQPGPDVFGVHVRISGKRYRTLQMGKEGSSLYLALAEVCDCLLEALNRYGDRKRVKLRSAARSSASQVPVQE